MLFIKSLLLGLRLKIGNNHNKKYSNINKGIRCSLNSKVNGKGNNLNRTSNIGNNSNIDSREIRCISNSSSSDRNT